MSAAPAVWVYRLAYFLSLARLPVGVIPYLCKIGLYRLSGGWLARHWHRYEVQALRAIGDLLNLALSLILMDVILSVAQSPLLQLCFLLALTGEMVRLLTEKGVMAISAAWQILPHRRIANWLTDTRLESILESYCAYYRLSDDERLAVILQNLKAKACTHPQTAQKLRYVNAFRIVPNETGLRCGNVRDIAHGEIFVHARWTNHSGLLYGLALRRSPWIFDPRYLARPFYYRTQANRLMTLFVFENAAICPLFVVYQFGQTIKSARYDAFYRILRWLRTDAEEPICEDGAYSFEPLATSLKMIPRLRKKLRPLWSDDEVLRDLTLHADATLPSPIEIAERYTYPLAYVEEVLFSKIQAHRANASTTASAVNAGASQCG